MCCGSMSKVTYTLGRNPTVGLFFCWRMMASPKKLWSLRFSANGTVTTIGHKTLVQQEPLATGCPSKSHERFKRDEHWTRRGKGMRTANVYGHLRCTDLRTGGASSLSRRCPRLRRRVHVTSNSLWTV